MSKNLIFYNQYSHIILINFVIKITLQYNLKRLHIFSEKLMPFLRLAGTRDRPVVRGLNYSDARLSRVSDIIRSVPVMNIVSHLLPLEQYFLQVSFSYLVLRFHFQWIIENLSATVVAG